MTKCVSISSSAGSYAESANRAEARADVFDYIEVFYNPRKKLKLKMTNQTALN